MATVFELLREQCNPSRPVHRPTALAPRASPCPPSMPAGSAQRSYWLPLARVSATTPNTTAIMNSPLWSFLPGRFLTCAPLITQFQDISEMGPSHGAGPPSFPGFCHSRPDFIAAGLAGKRICLGNRGQMPF